MNINIASFEPTIPDKNSTINNIINTFMNLTIECRCFISFILKDDIEIENKISTRIYAIA